MFEFIISIVNGLFNYVYIFRIGWVITVLLGLAMLMAALLSSRKKDKTKFHWILGSVGVVMVICSGTQLLFSYFW